MLVPFEYRRRRIDKRTPEQALVLLRDAAKHFGYREFGKRDLNAAKLGISSTGVQNAFGSWSAGVSALRAVLAEDGIVLVPRTRQVASDDDLFGEMQRVWTAVGHRPSQYEWQAASPAYHYNTYRSRFGGWSNACLLFLEWQMGESLEVGAASPAASRSACPTPGEFAPPPIEKRRNPPDRLRLRVLDRDGYRCVLCGRSPATEVGVVLHLDHIMPVADGGLTTYENLRTLCQQCNLGRGRDMQLGRGSV
jgi:hypothetical protein